MLVYVEPAGTTLKVSGTSNGGRDRLDLRCEGAATAVVDDNVRPTAAGVWTTTLSAADVSELHARTCYLHAVPHGNAGANHTAFPGKRVMFQRSRVTAVVGGPNNGVPYDFRYWAPQLNGRSIWQSFSNCGLAGAATIDARHVPLLGLRRSRARASSRPITSGRAGVLVDHVNTYTPVRRRDALPGLGQRARPARAAELGQHRPEHRQRAHPRDREPAALQPRPGRRSPPTAQTLLVVRLGRACGSTA